jgi:hypothetical protein
LYARIPDFGEVVAALSDQHDHACLLKWEQREVIQIGGVHQNYASQRDVGPPHQVNAMEAVL